LLVVILLVLGCTEQSEPYSGEPAFDVSSIKYSEKNNCVSGKVKGDVSGCHVILYIEVAGEYWVKPTQAGALSYIDSSGKFLIEAYSKYPPEAKASDLMATAYKLYLVKGEPSIDLHNYTETYLDLYEGTR
jgi:hypothetical protein